MPPALAGGFFTTSATWEAQLPPSDVLQGSASPSNLVSCVFGFWKTNPGLCVSHLAQCQRNVGRRRERRMLVKKKKNQKTEWTAQTVTHHSGLRIMHGVSSGPWGGTRGFSFLTALAWDCGQMPRFQLPCLTSGNASNPSSWGKVQ